MANMILYFRCFVFMLFCIYVIFDNENVEDDEKIDFILRYQASDAEVDKILSEGSFPEPNVYVITVTYYKNENKFVDESGEVLEL